MILSLGRGLTVITRTVPVHQSASASPPKKEEDEDEDCEAETMPEWEALLESKLAISRAAVTAKQGARALSAACQAAEALEPGMFPLDTHNIL